MAFGDPNWVSLLPGPPAESAVDAGRRGVLSGLDIGQKVATRHALQGLDINDPASTNTAIGSLVRAGALDQATGLMNLNFTRDLRSRVPALFDRLSGLNGQPPAASGSSQPAPPTPDPSGDAGMRPEDHQHIADTMSQGVEALTQIRKLPVEQRAAAFAQARDAFVQRGIPEAAVDAVGRDLSDAGLDQQIAYLGAHGEHFGAQAQPGATPAPPPTLAHPTQYAWASNLMGDPSLQAGLALAKTAGIDLSSLTDTARALVAPQITEQAHADYAQQIKLAQNVADLVTNPTRLQQEATGAGQKTLQEKLVALGIDPAIAGRVTAATEAAKAPYERVELPADPTTGAPRVESAAEFAAGHGGPAVAGVSQGPESGPPAGRTEAATVQAKASTDQLVADRQSSGQLQAQLVPLRTAYDLINSGQVHLGPGSETWNRVKSFVTNTLGVPSESVANYDQVHKYLTQIANQRATQFGQGTNEKLAVAASGSPNVNMSSLGAAEVLRVNIALARADAAKAAAYGNGAPEGYTAFASNYGRTTDPRAFMLDMLTPSERGKLYDTISKGAPSEKAAFANGVIAAEAAGYFHRSDVRRR